MSESSGNASPTTPAGAPKRPAPGTAGARKSASKSGRSRAREFVLQALYQHLVGRNSADAIDAFTRDLSGFHKADAAHYNTVLHGCIETAEHMDALITPLLDRKLAEISPIEHGAMWIGVFEFQHCPDVPWRVVLNECIELAKEFGGTDGHKYVNAVLGGLAPQLRPLEVAADQGRSAHKNAAVAQPGPATPVAASDAAAPAVQPAPDDSTPPPPTAAL